MKKFSLISGFCFLLLGCATGGVNRGVVAMKMSDSEAHVGFGANEVSVGDHLQLFHHECEPILAGERARPGKCKKIPHGHGEVIEVLSSDYSVVRFPMDTKFSEGDTVEKHPH